MNAATITGFRTCVRESGATPRLRFRREGEATVGLEAASEQGTPSTDKIVTLLEWKDLSAWRQNGSEHLQTGYRREGDSVLDCFRSWGYVHNDTVNIYSHVIGMAIFVALPLYFFGSEIPPRYELATRTELLVCGVYFVGVALCFLFSVLFHTFMSHSESWYLLGIKFDYQGILLLMWGSTVPLVYHSFPCDAVTRVLYWAATTFLAILCSIATFHPLIGGPHLGHVRAVLFGAFGFGSFFVPIIHGIIRFGRGEQSQRIGLVWIILTATFNVIAMVFYGYKFPERWSPRRFDRFGASHQIMHVFVVFAALSYAKAVLRAFDFYHDTSRTNEICS